MIQAHPDGVLAHPENGLPFLAGGRWIFLHRGAQALRSKLAPMAPTDLGCQRSALRRRQVAIDAAPGALEAARGFGLGAARLAKLHDPFTEIKGPRFQAVTLADYVPMSI